MKYEVSHRTTYSYRLPVTQSQHLIHLAPRSSARQRVVHHSLLIDPAPIVKSEIHDYFGNTAILLRIDDQHSEFVVHARSTVELSPPHLPELEATPPWEEVTASLAKRPIDLEAVQYVCKSRQAPTSYEFRDFAAVSFTPGRPVLSGAMDLTQRMFREFKFDPTATDISTPVAQVLRNKRGVCQDFAHLAISSLRSLGLPARYVSGYLLTRPPPGQPKLQGADASHAWFSLWSPDTGWVDFDPTNGVMPSLEHITVAYGRDYDDISPISGVLLGGGDQVMTVAVDVEPLH